MSCLKSIRLCLRLRLVEAAVKVHISIIFIIHRARVGPLKSYPPDDLMMRRSGDADDLKIKKFKNPGWIY